MNTCCKPSTPKPTARHRKGLVWLLAAVTLLLFLLNLAAGASDVSLTDVMRFLSGQPVPDTVRTVLLHIRLPRALSCVLCGGALAVSGLLLQAALGNSLASPSTIGVNAGAGFFALLAAALFPYNEPARAAGLLLGALLVAGAMYLVAKKASATRLTIVLAGVAVSSLFSAGMDAIVTIRPETLLDKAAFSIGGFSSVSLSRLPPALLYMLPGFLGAALLAPRLNILLLGDETAASLGLDVRRCRVLSLCCAAFLAAGAVSVCGLLGFVGLIVPHMLRAAEKDVPGLVPLCGLGGAALVSLCDLIARTAFAPFELPVGILLSFLGAPFFLYLILHKKRGRLS